LVEVMPRVIAKAEFLFKLLIYFIENFFLDNGMKDSLDKQYNYF
jgi:hypothetical protein